MSALELEGMEDGMTKVSVSSDTGSDEVTVRVVDALGMINTPRSIELGTSAEILFISNPVKDGQKYEYSFTKMNGSPFNVELTQLGNGRATIKPLEAGSLNINCDTSVLDFDISSFADLTVGTTPEDVSPAIVPSSGGEFVQVDSGAAKTVTFDIQPSNYYNLEMEHSLGNGDASVFSVQRVPSARIPTFVISAKAVGTDSLHVWPKDSPDSSLSIPLNSVKQEFAVLGLDGPLNKGETKVVTIKPSPEHDEFEVRLLDFSYPPSLEIEEVENGYALTNLRHFPCALIAEGSVGELLNLTTYHWIDVTPTSAVKITKKPKVSTPTPLGGSVDMSIKFDKPMKYMEVYFMGALTKVCHEEAGALEFAWTLRINKEDQFGNYSFVAYEDKNLDKYVTAYTTVRPS